MTPKRELGDFGEGLAEDFLRQKGYKILQRNFRVPKGEIDIIAEKDEKTIFIEVKTRQSNTFGNAIEGVGSQKINRMYKAIDAYFRAQYKDPDEEPFQIDIVGITAFPHKTPSIVHIENAVEFGDY